MTPEEKAQRNRENSKRWYEKNKEKKNEKTKTYYQENTKKITELSSKQQIKYRDAYKILQTMYKHNTIPEEHKDQVIKLFEKNIL